MTTEPDRHGIDPDETLRAIDGEPSFDGLVQSIAAMMNGPGALGDGWGGIDTSGAALAKQRGEHIDSINRQANVFRDAFSTEAGRAALAMMVEQTIFAEPYPPEAQLPMEAITPLVIAHTAQCQFVRAILQAIAQAEAKQA